jgi:mono/diheme cytochrome c family protein
MGSEETEMAMRSLAALAALALASCSGVPGGEQQASLTADGKAIAEAECGSCHATGRDDASPRPDAPPFRYVLAHYPSEPLADAFVEGLKVGHPDMPQFQMNPQGVDALLAYLQSIQREPPPSP